MFLVTLFSFIVALSVLVFVHELGHYLSARRVGIVVEEFGFGYPPRLFSFWHTRGKIVIDDREIIVPRKFQLPEGLAAGSRVVFQAETDDKERVHLTRIREVEPDDEAAPAASTVDYVDPGTLFSINAIPFGGFAKMRGEEDPTYPGSLASKSKLARTFVLSAGALMNLVTAVAFFALAMGLGAPAIADPENAMVTGLAPGSPGDTAGLPGRAGGPYGRAGLAGAPDRGGAPA